MEMPAPDGEVKINWADAGTVGHIRDQLQGVLDLLG